MRAKFNFLGIIIFFLFITFLHTRKAGQCELSLLNIEALANDESGGSKNCFYKGSVVCPFTGDKVYMTF